MVFYIILLMFILIVSSSYIPAFNIKIGKFVISINEKNRFWFAIVLMIVVASVRYGIGYDYYNYVARVNSFRGFNFSTNYECISQLILYIAKKLNSPQLLFIIYAVITYVCIGIFVNKYSDDKNEAILIYFCLYYSITLSTVRQAAAVAVLALGYQYIKDRKFWKYLIVCLIATMIHQYAFVGIALYFVYYMNIYTTAIISLILTFTLKPIIVWLGQRLFVFEILSKWYFTGKEQSGNIWLIVNFCICIYIAFMLFAKKNKYKWDDETKRILNIVVLGTMFPFFLGTSNGRRIGEYFLIYNLLLIPLCHKKMDKKFKVIFNMFMIIIYIGYLYTTIQNGTHYIPYVTIWDIIR